MRLVAGLPAEEVDRRVREAARWTDIGNRALAFYLADLDQRGLCQVLGHPTVVSYGVRELGMSRRRVRELLLAGRRLPELPAIDAAFDEGVLPWSRVRRLCVVATPETEADWLAFAFRSSQEELDRHVAVRRRGERPARGDGLRSARFRVVAELDALQHEVWENARQKLRAELGIEAELTDADLLTEMARLVLSSDADGTVPGRRPVDGSIYRVVVRVPDGSGPAGSAGSAGPAGAAGAETGGTATVVAEDTEIAIPGALAELASEQAAVSPRLRRRVLDRDDHRCRHCGSRRNPQLHHVQWRSRGGATTEPNLVTLCGRCHGLAHQDLLDVEVAHGATGPAAAPATQVAHGATGPATAPATEVAHGATGPAGRPADRPAAETRRPARSTFVFRDKDGRRLGRRWREGPRIERVAGEPESSTGEPESARGTAPGPRRAAPPVSIVDPEWLREHLHWFESTRGGLRLKPRYRSAFEQMFPA